jgi:3-dehydroquinate synthase
MDIVAQDEFDANKRQLLNLGHTIGHALEAHIGMPHGHSVAIGMSLDVKIARMMNMCDEQTPLLLSNLLQAFNLPEEFDFDVKKIMEIIAYDKKRMKNSIRYIVPVAPGNCQIVDMDATRLENYLYKLMK